MTKFYALQKDVFDINKVTVVGNPTITEDGVASGFSDGNYIQSIYQLIIGKTYEFMFSFVGVENNTTTSVWLASIPFAGNGGDSFNLRIIQGTTGSNLLRFALGAAKSDVVTNTVIQTGKEYNIKIITDFSTFVDLIDLETNNKTSQSYSYAPEEGTYTINIGTNSRGDRPFLGSIDLTAFKIYVDNELVYSPTKPITYLERRKEGFDLSKFTIVGSPTITEGGVASGFTLDNYLTASQTLDLSKPFKICMGFLHKDVTKQETLMSFNGGIWENYLLVNHFSYGDTLPFYLRFEDNTTANITVSNYVLKDNTFYYIEFLWDGSVYTLRVSENNKDWGEATYASSKALYGYSSINTICIGKMIAKNYYPFETGSIDLSQFSITVDGEEVFTGAKEKFYAMKGNM